MDIIIVYDVVSRGDGFSPSFSSPSVLTPSMQVQNFPNMEEIDFSHQEKILSRPSMQCSQVPSGFKTPSTYSEV